MKTSRFIILMVGLAFIGSLIVWVVLSFGSTESRVTSTIPGITTTDHVRGPKNAPAVLIEYSDFACTGCDQYEQYVRQVIDYYGDRVALVYRHFPLTQLHPNAQLAVQAAQAADRQGKFWVFHDLLFDRQDSWTTSVDARSMFIGFAADQGLALDQFTADLDSQLVKDRIQTDVDSGLAAHIKRTPTFFLNGKIITTPRTFAGFAAQIDRVLKKN